MSSTFAMRRHRPWYLVVALLIFALAYGVTAWRLDAAPDLFTDEIQYARAGVRILGEGAMVWDRGAPIYVHPPLYFLAEAAFFGLTGSEAAPLYAPGDIFALVYHTRFLNALVAGATATLLYLIGRRLRGDLLGLLLVALFVVDPFALRTNRRAMLETMAALLTLCGMAVLLVSQTSHYRATLARSVVAGLLLGAALLTKELAFLAPAAVLVYGAWQMLRARTVSAEDNTPGPGRKGLAWVLLPSLVTVVAAALTYSLYPLWILASEGWDGFSQVKWLSLQRLFGLVQISGWNRPGLSLADLLIVRLSHYATTYLLLGLGAVSSAWLLLRHRHTRQGRLLVSWGLVLYPFFGFVALFGSGNDQFFYFLLLPAILFVGYALATVWDAVQASPARSWWFGGASILLLLILVYNLASWWTSYGVGLDNAYYRQTAFVQEQLPDAQILNATGDAIKFRYFFPERLISAAATPDEARAIGVHYFFLALKDVEGQYGRSTPELAAWIEDNGQLLHSVEGESYGRVDLYHVPYQQTGDPVLPPTADLDLARPRQRTFVPAQGGYVADLILAMALWTLIVGAITIWLRWDWRIGLSPPWRNLPTSARRSPEDVNREPA